MADPSPHLPPMPSDPDVLRLVEEALDSGSSAEEVCRDRPDLRAEVGGRLEHARALAGELDALFPPAPAVRPSRRAPRGTLPEIPGYAIETQVGVGGMGVVYRARHLKLKRPVAIKMVVAGAYATPAERECLIREAQACSKLQHPHIIQVFDVGEADGLPYFTMEYLEGGTLAARLAATPILARDAATLTATIASAVQAAHQAGIVHRDLKPANIMLTLEGTPKVGDFSLARDVGGRSGLTLSNLRVGTPSYMAPEQIRGGEAALKPTVDVYALGAALYEMLTGRPPFRGETPEETQRQVLAGDPAPPSRLNPNVPADLENICLKALAPDPAKRYATAAALADDVGRFLRGEPVTARRARAAERAVKWVRRRPTLALAIAAGVFIAAAGCIVFGRAAWERMRVEDAARRDLTAVRESQRSGRWAEARAALDRAAARAGEGAGAIRAEIDAARRDQRLVEDLAAVRLDRAAEPARDFARGKSAARYAELFANAGLIRRGEPAADAAARIAASNVREIAVAAVDLWSTFAVYQEERKWLHEIARRADPDPAWRDRVRNVDTWLNAEAAAELADAADVDRAPIQLLLILANVLDAHDARVPKDGPVREGRGLAFMKRVHAAHPGDFWANFLLGEILSKDEPAEAVGYFRAAIAVSPDAVGAYVNLALCLIRVGGEAEAFALWQKSVEMAPTLAVARSQLAIYEYQRMRYEEAYAHARAAADLDENDSEAALILGRSMIRLRRPEEALKELERSLVLMTAEDTNREVAEREIQTAKYLVPYERATDEERARGLERSNGLQAHILAVVFSQVNRASEAGPYYARTIEVDPAEALRRDPHVRYNAACMALQIGSAQDQSERKLEDVGAWRERAVGWLEEELAALRGAGPERAAEVRKTLAHWKKDEDLRSIRDPEEQGALAERVRALWAGVEELAVRLGAE